MKNNTTMRKVISIMLLATLSLAFAQAEEATSVTINAHQQAKQEWNKPVHYFGIGLKAGYSQFSQGFNKSDNQHLLNSSMKVPGGANAGLELKYKLEYKLFRFTVGVDATYAGSSMKGDIAYQYGMLKPSTDMTYFYNFGSMKEQQHTFEVGVPIMFGANFRGFYAMAGMRIGLPVMKTYTLNTDMETTIKDHRGIDIYTDMENHKLVTRSYKNSDKGLNISMINPQVALEVGYNLDPFIKRNNQFEWKPGAKPSFAQLLHYEIALYANVGVMNYHKNSEDRNQFFELNDDKVSVKDIHSLTDDAQLKKGNLLPWNIGVKFSIYYERYNKPVEKVARKRRPRPKKEKKEEVIQVVEEPKDTIVYSGETIQKGDTIIMDNLYFDTDKSTIRSASDASLNELASLLQSHPTMKITLVGHTDNVGKADYNMRLSKARVESVRNALIQRGIDGNRIKTVGKGMTEPIADNKTKEGRAQNRRVEIVIDEE